MARQALDSSTWARIHQRVRSRGWETPLGSNYRDYTLGIFAPTVTKIGFGKGAKQQIRTAVAETRDAFGGGVVSLGAKKPQKIITWWPESENTQLRQGIKVMSHEPPAEWIKGTVNLETTKKNDPNTPQPEKFSYHGGNETFFIAFVHEMVHAYNGLIGAAKDETTDEEQQTVGINAFVNNKYTENKFRALFSMKLRADYKSMPSIPRDVTIVQSMTPFCQLHDVQPRAPRP